MIKTRLVLAAAVVLLSAAPPGWAAESSAKQANFVNLKALDLATLLPPPPAVDSAQTKAELAEIHGFEKSRTVDREKIAQDDQTETVFEVVRGDLGPDFTEAKLPVTAAFFAKLLADEDLVVDPAKTVWARPRPAAADPSVKLCVKGSTSGSYPSGHSTVAHLAAIVLSDMLPEKRGLLFADAARFAESRVVCGVHYRSDIEASKTVAALIAQQIRTNPVFQKEFAAAKVELLHAIPAKTAKAP